MFVLLIYQGSSPLVSYRTDPKVCFSPLPVEVCNSIIITDELIHWFRISTTRAIPSTHGDKINF